MFREISVHLKIGVLVVSLAILGCLFWLIYFQPVGTDALVDSTRWLPHFNACCNALSFSFVVLGIRAIKRGYKLTHIAFMIAALTASAAFLCGYLVYHYYHGDTRYAGDGILRLFYFSLLITHILFSVIVLPQLLFTILFAGLRKWELHRRFARWTFPQWMYVSATGVLVFLMLRVF